MIFCLKPCADVCSDLSSGSANCQSLFSNDLSIAFECPGKLISKIISTPLNFENFSKSMNSFWLKNPPVSQWPSPQAGAKALRSPK